jgi:hypothetical protein
MPQEQRSSLLPADLDAQAAPHMAEPLRSEQPWWPRLALLRCCCLLTPALPAATSSPDGASSSVPVMLLCVKACWSTAQSHWYLLAEFPSAAMLLDLICYSSMHLTCLTEMRLCHNVTSALLAAARLPEQQSLLVRTPAGSIQARGNYLSLYQAALPVARCCCVVAGCWLLLCSCPT